MIRAIERLMKILAITAPAFFMRERPVSSIAKPACMKMTRTAASTTQIVLMAVVIEASSCAAASAGATRSSAIAQIGARRKARNVICAPREGEGPRGGSNVVEATAAAARALWPGG
jgi:hypothetical protein